MARRLANAATERLAEALGGQDEPMDEAGVLRVLARIARTGKPGDRLRAAELIGKHLGMFRDEGPGEGVSLTDLILRAGRKTLQPVTVEVVGNQEGGPVDPS
jgi:hypothetical protein